MKQVYTNDKGYNIIIVAMNEDRVIYHANEIVDGRYIPLQRYGCIGRKSFDERYWPKPAPAEAA